jgi:gliding motility-associated-like protein
MARRTFTNIVLALGLLCSIVVSTAVEAQQVTFAISPSQVTPAVGDTLKLNLTVQNFTNIVSFQYALEWDAALMSFIGIDSLNIPDPSNFSTNPVGGNTLLASWNASGAGKTIPTGQRVFRIRLKVTAASSNYWMKFSDANIGTIEVIQDPGLRAVTPIFNNLGTPPGNTTLPVGGKITGATTLTNQKVCVPVTTTDFTNIVSAQWVNKWNSTVLRFDSVSTLNNTLGLRATNFGVSQAGSGRLTFSWNAASGSVSVANNDTLYKVCYTAIGANGTSSIVTFDSSEVYRRASGSDTRVALNGVNGTVTVGTVVVPPSSGLSFVASNHNINAGDTVCMKIRVGGFTDIAVMQWSMHFDSTKMTLLGITSTAGIGIVPWVSSTNQGDNFNNLINGAPSGTLRFLWISPSNTGAGYTLPDSTVLMELCFRYIGAGNTNSTLRFDGIPLKAQVKDVNLINVPATFRTGTVTAGVVALPANFTSVVKNVTCPGGNDGTITLTPSGGNGTYTYTWKGPNSFTATSKDLATRTAGKYYVTVTSNATTKVDSFSVTEPAAFAITSQVTHVSCKGGNDGAIALTVAGGTAPYTYVWMGSTATTKDLASLTAGIYKLTLTDAKGCTISRADTITEPAAALAVTTVPTAATCKNGSTGAIATTVVGGTTPYSYSWISNNGTAASTKDLANLVAGTYNLTVTDAKNCKATKIETITEPDSIKIGPAVIVGTRCSQLTGKITISAITGGTGPYTFSWAAPANSPIYSSQNLVNIAPGQYVLTVNDSKNCSATASYAVVDTAANITNSIPTVTNVKCFGGNNGAITLTATGAGPLTYSWTGPNGFTASTLAISNLKMGNYTLAINDAGCTKTIAVSVTEPTAIASAIQSVNVKCKGEGSGSIALNATGGTAPLSITWTGPNGYTGTGQNIASLKAGVYNATISDANTCTKTESVTLTEPTDSLKIINAAVTNLACNSANSNGNDKGKITLTVAGGTPQYNYTWTGIGGFTSTQKDIINLIGGEYRVTVADANGCTATRTLNVVEPAAINVTAGTTDASGTPNGTINLSVTGGQGAPYTFLWTGQGVAPTTQNQTGLCPGTYSVAVKDAAQCAVSKSVTVGGSCSTPIRIIGSPNIVNAGCSGQNAGRIDVIWEGGVAPFHVDWLKLPNNDVINTIDNVLSRNATLGGQPAGSYRIRILDAIGQSFLSTVLVINGTVTPLNIGVALTNETCAGNDGSITLTVTNGANPYSYKWANGSGLPAAQPSSRSDLRAGLYSITVTDANGCAKDTNNIALRRTPCALTVNSNQVNPRCFGNDNGSITINISNGEPSYTIRWGTNPNQQTVINNANSRGGSYTITNLAAGTYVVTITDVANQTQTVTHTLVPPPQITVDRRITGDQGSCNGSIILTVNGGVQPYAYQWNTGATSRDLFNLCCNDGRQYSVNVRDGNQCVVTTQNEVIPCTIAILTLDSSRIRNPVCKSDETNSRIDVFIKGGVLPLIYEWRNSVGTVVGGNSPILFNQPPGRYYLTVVDSRTPTPQRIIFDAALTVSSTFAASAVSTTDASDNEKADGGTKFTITPGTAPYTIRWQDGSTVTQQSAIAENTKLKAGTAEVTVTDATGCVVKFSVTINSRACVTVKKNTEFFTQKDTFNIRCANNPDGGASIIAFRSDVVLPIRAFEWKSSGETGQTAFKLAPGLNEVKITDANGKVCSTSFTLKAPLPLRDTIWVDNKARTLEAVTMGGVAPYTYAWTTDNADKTSKVTVSRTGTYFVVVKDAFGCDVTDKAIIYFDAKCLEGAVILTPNDDGLNEFFKVNTCGYKTIRLEVYNRWGQQVYVNNDYRQTWYGNKEDGPSGDPLPEGVYMYILSATDGTGKQQLGKGTVNIVRN